MPAAARESRVEMGRAKIYCREIGDGPPILVLHGGPDFNHRYFLPELDVLASSFRLLYYDQRGRGKSEHDVLPEDVSLESEIEDLEAVRRHFNLLRVAVLGHSWGGLLAMEHAIRHPGRQTHLILMNSGPASAADYAFFKSERRRTEPDNIRKMEEMGRTPDYVAGDLGAERDYYRVHYAATLRDPERREDLLRRLRADFSKESTLKARRMEDRLMEETWARENYDLLPKLRELSVKTLILHGDHDFVPLACVERIAQAIPGARLEVFENSGHFSYLEYPERVRESFLRFFEA